MELQAAYANCWNIERRFQLEKNIVNLFALFITHVETVSRMPQVSCCYKPREENRSDAVTHRQISEKFGTLIIPYPETGEPHKKSRQSYGNSSAWIGRSHSQIPWISRMSRVVSYHIFDVRHIPVITHNSYSNVFFYDISLVTYYDKKKTQIRQPTDWRDVSSNCYIHST